MPNQSAGAEFCFHFQSSLLLICPGHSGCVTWVPALHVGNQMEFCSLDFMLAETWLWQAVSEWPRTWKTNSLILFLFHFPWHIDRSVIDRYIACPVLILWVLPDWFFCWQCHFYRKLWFSLLPVFSAKIQLAWISEISEKECGFYIITWKIFPLGR